jgi:predicted kinase
MSKILYIIRGLPGSGKSTLAHSLVHDAKLVCEADKYHIDKNGKYDWKPENVKAAHSWCQNQVKNMMSHTGFGDFYKKIVVSNTFTQEWEMQVYLDMAKEYGYMVFSIIVENRHDGVNQHGVPDDTLTKMRDRFEIKL